MVDMSGSDLLRIKENQDDLDAKELAIKRTITDIYSRTGKAILSILLSKIPGDRMVRNEKKPRPG